MRQKEFVLSFGRIAKLFFCSAVVLASISLSVDASADPTKKDFEILAKAIGFIDKGPAGNVSVDVIGDGSEADFVLGFIGEGLSSGKVKLIGAKGDNGAKVAYITSDAYNQADALNQSGVITVSTEPDCAISNKCVLSVTSTPKVEIHVSKQAAYKAGVSFSSTFVVMITEH